MQEQLSLLIGLQAIDAKIRTLREHKGRLPEVLAELERKRLASKENFDKVKEALATAQKNKRDRDQDLDAGMQKVEKLKSRSAEIKNNKEYQALLKEIQTAEQENKTVEDDILVLMEKIDSANAQILVAERQTKEDEVSILEEQRQHEAAFARLGEELKAMEQARQEEVARIDPSVLAQYQKLLTTKGGVALAEVRGESCSGCYMSIPPQVYVNVKRNEQLINCPQCGRILYYKEAIVQNNP
jgi:uncharacterized protein